jgi:hypothetical protein
LFDYKHAGLNMTTGSDGGDVIAPKSLILPTLPVAPQTATLNSPSNYLSI